MDKSTLEANAGIINAACRDWFVPLGGGSVSRANAVRVASFRWNASDSQYGMQARVQSAWYWLTEQQIEFMVAQSRALTGTAA